MDTVTITLPAHIVMETLIALRDRRATLSTEKSTHVDKIVREIARRQLARVTEAGEALAAAVGETF